MIEPTGLDLRRLAAWLVAAVPGAGMELSAELIAGGRSNLTYELTDGTSTWVLRRPPLGHVLATAHDMAREHAVMSALEATPVPVPAMVALCDDPSVIGAPFYLMSKVAGTPYRRAAELERRGPESTKAISICLVDTLTALHQVDPVEVGLGDFGRVEGFLGRQVFRWGKQLAASYCRDLPAADELHAILATNVPRESAESIVHGDYRLDNVLMDPMDSVAGVIDWEMATIGDPLTDVALLLVYARLGELGLADDVGAVVGDVTLAPGFLSPDEIIARYATVSGRDLSALGFYLGLAAYKLAVILEGIHYRYLRGQTVGPGFDGIGAAIHPLLHIGLDAIKENL